MAEDDISGDGERRPPKAPLGGRLAWWPFAAALSAVVVLVLVVVGVNVFAGGGTTGSRQQGTGLTSGGAVACPEFYEHADTDWVPARPAGVHPKKKLVPKLHPTHVTVCRYAKTRNKNTSVRLAGQRELGGRLDDAIDTLRAAPADTKHSPCSTPATVADRDYLIGMRYAEAIVWVSAPGLSCGSGNGVFESSQNLERVAAASFAAGKWVGSPK